MIQAFIFDLDGVITDTAHFHYLAWKEMGKKIGITVDEKLNESLKGISRMDSLELILKSANKQNEFTKKEKEKIAIQKNSYYVSLIQDITSEDILPGIKKLLEDIRKNNIKIGLASASKNAIEVLENLNIKQYFDYIADASKCKNSKPAPDIFIMAAKGLNVNPLYCIGIEDASAGIEAINLANMYSVGVGDKNVLHKAKFIVDSTEKLNFEELINKFRVKNN